MMMMMMMMIIIIIIIIIHVPIAVKSGSLNPLEKLRACPGPHRDCFAFLPFLYTYIILPCICLCIMIHSDSNSKILFKVAVHGIGNGVAISVHLYRPN
jgi:hypothetical protein